MTVALLLHTLRLGVMGLRARENVTENQYNSRCWGSELKFEPKSSSRILNSQGISDNILHWKAAKSGAD